jgi:hypothetical protein
VDQRNSANMESSAVVRVLALSNSQRKNCGLRNVCVQAALSCPKQWAERGSKLEMAPYDASARCPRKGWVSDKHLQAGN